MAWTITKYEDTPNPDALKCWLDHSISEGPVSFLSVASAGGHPVAEAIFDSGMVKTLLLNGEWLTVCRVHGTRWPALKKQMEQVLAEVE